MLLLLKQVSTGPVAKWIRHRPTEPGIVGSSPTGVNYLGSLVLLVSCSTEVSVR